MLFRSTDKEVSLLDIWVGGLNNLGDTVGGHWLIKLEWWRVGLDGGIAHAAAHVWVEGADEVLEEDALLWELGLEVNLGWDGLKVLAWDWDALWDLAEDELLVLDHFCGCDV